MGDDFAVHHYATWKGVPANELDDESRGEMIRYMGGIEAADYRPLVRFAGNEVVIPARRGGKTAALMEKIAADTRRRIDDHVLDAIGYGVGGTFTNTVSAGEDSSFTLEKLDEMIAVMTRFDKDFAERKQRAELEAVPGFGAF